ncbi:MAG TPA: hypothetical protein VMT52_16375 [Planctomycetota bacterium]|nr:hypothetical protein [Planctomycetota bacterium]
MEPNSPRSRRWWLWLFFGLVWGAVFTWQYMTDQGLNPILSFVFGWCSGGFITQAWCERPRGRGAAER